MYIQLRNAPFCKMGTTHKTSISQEKQKADFKETSLSVANFYLRCHY